MHSRIHLLSLGIATALVAPGFSFAQQSQLALKPGDHVAILGNALADRMQHSGWLETFIHAKHPGHQLVVRNLAVAGDEVNTWHRSQDFGSRDEWLRWTAADVVFAFYGYGESLAGYAGIERFKADLENFLKDTAQNYSGKGAPRVVLFSPIAQEKTADRNHPDPAANNTNLQNYTAAMAEVAKANNVPFVDLFTPTQKLFAARPADAAPYTVNGHYLTEAGEKALSSIIMEKLFGQSASAAKTGDIAKLREAVLEKNHQWHQRYRTIDGYNVYGGRSRLAFAGKLPDGTETPKISNNEVMQREMQQRDVITANRDKRLWAVASGRDLPVTDDNLPAPVKVGTNKPGDRPDLLHTFLGGEEAIAKMKVHSGMKVNLFADEKQFPELVNPVQMAWDTRGRLWVAAWTNYPGRTPDSKVGDKLIVLEDTDGNGQADKCTTFLDDLNGPTGFQFYKDGVLVMQAPDLWFVRDTNGDGKADWKERVLMGLDSADSHHQTNAMCLDPGGAVYLSDGVFHRTQVETAYGITRNQDAAIFRFEPNTGKFETYAAYGFANPHGRLFDGWGNDLITDATGNNTYFGPAISGWIDYPQKHPKIKEFWKRPSRPCPGTGWLSSRHFPEEFQDNFLNCNVISFQGIFRVKVSQDGSGLKGETLEDIVSSPDQNFRPSVVNIGPDGALYFADWSNAIIGHMQHHLRDPNRDHQHGRVYRMTYEGRPLLQPAKIHGEPIEALLELLKAHENGTRELAKIELGKHDSTRVISATKKWLAGLNAADKNFEHQRLEGLWVHQWHNVVDASLLKSVLASPEPRARAAAVRVLTYWRDRVPEALDLLAKAAGDQDPRVRLFAARGASFFNSLEAVDVALAAAAHPTDEYLDYVITETLRQLEPVWRKAISEGKALAAGSPAGLRFLLDKLKPDELMKLPETPEVLAAIVSRPGFSEAQRTEALMKLAKARNSTVVAEVLGAIEPLAKEGKNAAPDLARLLARQPSSDLKPVRERLSKLTGPGIDERVRLGAMAAIVLADGSFDPSWTAAIKNGHGRPLVDLLNSVPLISDPSLRATIRERALQIAMEQKPASTPGAAGRFVRIEIPRDGTLTLAEVQVMSDGVNVARGGKATQSSTSNNGVADRAIDGRTDGAYSSGTQTHTRENEKNPWWEVDLGKAHPIESIVVWNRSESGGQYARRLDGFSVRVLDEARNPVFEKTSNPAPPQSASIAVSGDTSGAARRAAIAALAVAGGNPAETFTSLTRLIENRDQVQAAASRYAVCPARPGRKIRPPSRRVGLRGGRRPSQPASVRHPSTSQPCSSRATSPAPCQRRRRRWFAKT
jgi:glucose/arabinose dehydrogenase